MTIALSGLCPVLSGLRGVGESVKDLQVIERERSHGRLGRSLVSRPVIAIGGEAAPGKYVHPCQVSVSGREPSAVRRRTLPRVWDSFVLLL